MLDEHRERFAAILMSQAPLARRIEQIEAVCGDYIDWLDHQIMPQGRPWYEYTSNSRDYYFREGLCVHVKEVHHGNPSRRLTLLSIRHLEDKPIKDWNLFLRIKNHFIGPDKYAIEIYPPVGEIRDSSFTYHLLEWPEPLGFAAMCARQ
jgi:hypothetical protein